MLKKLFSGVVVWGAFVASGASAATAKVDTGASELKWEGKKVAGAHQGTLGLKSGELTVEGDKITGGHFEVDMTSLKNSDVTDPEWNTKLINHLKSDDFFSIEKNPTAVFVVKSVKPGTGGMNEVTGDLTIKGKTNELTFPAKITHAKGKFEATGTATVDRTKYDIRFRSGKFFKDLGDKVIHDDFTVTMKLVANVDNVPVSTKPSKKK